MKLIVGLGNPGAQYEKTRHNVGFIAIDSFAKTKNVEFKLDLKLKSMICLVNDLGNKYILLKPMTYMNLSGQAVRLVMDYYNIDINDIVIINDDLDSISGRVRLRDKGSAGGHNGLKSIIESLGTDSFKRIKIGIDRSSVIPVVDYVLQKFSKDEEINILSSIDLVAKILDEFSKGTSFKDLANKYSK